MPLVMNEVDIVIQQLNVTTTQWYQDYREAVGKKRRDASITLRGQVNYGHKRTVYDKDLSLTGDMETTKAHIVFDYEYLIDEGYIDDTTTPHIIKIRKGDKIIRIANTQAGFVITQVRPESPLDEEFELLYCDFEIDYDEHASRT